MSALADAVEKGICRNLKATLIQDWKPMRNLDSKLHLLGFVCFKFQFHISFAEAFSTVSAQMRIDDMRLPMSPHVGIADVLALSLTGCDLQQTSRFTGVDQILRIATVPRRSRLAKRARNTHIG
jgi:hypothetical protein